MTKLIRRPGRGEKGFTLVELVVVIAILGVLAAVATPLVTNFLGQSKESAYKAETDVIQAAVEGYFADPGNPRFQGKRSYPLIGLLQTDSLTLNRVAGSTAVKRIDQLDPKVVGLNGAGAVPSDGTSTTKAIWSPNGATEGKDIKTPSFSAWTDGGKAETPTDLAADGVRDSLQKDATANNSGDTWTTVTATRGDQNYQVDSRYYFIDFDELVFEKFMDAPPKSASRDNCPKTTVACTGSYIWYLDAAGRVQSLLAQFPSTKGYADVFP